MNTLPAPHALPPLRYINNLTQPTVPSQTSTPLQTSIHPQHRLPSHGLLSISSLLNPLPDRALHEDEDAALALAFWPVLDQTPQRLLKHHENHPFATKPSSDPWCFPITPRDLRVPGTQCLASEETQREEEISHTSLSISSSVTTATSSVCQSCGSRISHLSTHKCKNTVRDFQCSFAGCNHRASRAYDLRVHERTHTGEKPFVCPQCGKSCAHSTTLAYHMRTHTGEKPYTCNYEGCGKRFSNVSNLTVHARVHTGERPYPCLFDGCSKAFRISTDLARHARTHTGDKPFSCAFPGCGKSFSQRSHLSMHIKSKMHER